MSTELKTSTGVQLHAQSVTGDNAREFKDAVKNVIVTAIQNCAIRNT
jgi:hypothetical protein